MRIIFGAVATAVVVMVFGVSAQELHAPVYALEIVSPPDEAVVFDDGGNVRVEVAVAPGLADGDQVEFLVDGFALGPPATVLEIPAFGILPGPHVLQARIIDASGNVGALSPSIHFHVWREALRRHVAVPPEIAPVIRTSALTVEPGA